jgi:hypothetical protein
MATLIMDSFYEAIWTNNDCEELHLRINYAAGNLLQLFNKEAGHVLMQASLLSNNKLKRVQRKRYQDLQAKVFNL